MEHKIMQSLLSSHYTSNKKIGKNPQCHTFIEIEKAIFLKKKNIIREIFYNFQLTVTLAAWTLQIGGYLIRKQLTLSLSN